jgi:hypothetical protein
MFAPPLKLTPPMVLAVWSVDAVDALPVSVAVIVPALKLPEPSRFTIALAVLAFVAALAADTALLMAVWVPLTAPVMLGNVALIVLFIRRM